MRSERFPPWRSLVRRVKGAEVCEAPGVPWMLNTLHFPSHLSQEFGATQGRAGDVSPALLTGYLVTASDPGSEHA